MSLTKEEFWNNWELEWIQQIKAGDEIIAEVDFAVPKWAKDKAWELLNDSVRLEEIIKISKSFEFSTGDICWRIKKKC